MRKRFSSIFILLLPLGSTPRPISLVHQDSESAQLRKGPTDGSAFAREAASAAAAATAATAARAGKHGRYDLDDFDLLPAQPAHTSRSAEINPSLGDFAPSEDGLRDSMNKANRALAVIGERPGSGLMVAGTVDGQVHALDPVTGDMMWSFSTGEPLLKSYQQLPGTLDEKRWLIPTLDGSMLVHTTQGLKRPGINARLLVEQTPFLAPGGTFYTGSKVSRIFGVDARTGELRQVLSGDTQDSLESNRRLLAQSGSDDDVIWIGRNDHTIRAFDVPTGQEEWNLTIGEFVPLDGLYRSASSGTSGSGNSRSRPNAAIHPDLAPSLIATPDGSLRSQAPVGKAGKTADGSEASLPSIDWNVPLPAHVASVFRVTLEEGSDHTFLPLENMPLLQHAEVRSPAVSSGSGGTAAVGVLENGQVYAVALDDQDSDGGDGGDIGGAGGSRAVGGGGATGGHVSRGKKGRAGEGKVTHGGRTTAMQPLLPHGDWQRDSGDGGDHGGGSDGAGHGVSGTLVQSFSLKGVSHHAVSGPPRSCQPGHPDFPNCLSGVHTVQHIGGEEQARLSLSMGLNSGSAIDGGAGSGAGNRDSKGVRTSTGYVSRLPPLSYGSGVSPPGRGSGVGSDGGLAEIIGGLGIGGGTNGNFLAPAPGPQAPLTALLSWLYRGWSIVSLGILAVVVMIFVDSRRAAKIFKQVGLGGYPLYANGGGGEYDPSADSGFSGTSEASASATGASGGGGTGTVAVGGVKGELRVGCLTVSDTVLGYGSHGTVVYRGLLEGRPVAVKRMLTDFHARADREISLLIESDGHPNVVRYFVREEAGEFVYLALQLCQLSLHNAMAQIHATMAQARRMAELENEGKTSALRVGLGHALTKDDVSAPPELRAALLQVSQGVEHLHSLRIVHRDLKPHNILLAAKDRKGPGLGRKIDNTDGVKGKAEGEQMAPRKLGSMRDIASFVLKISDMGLGKQLLNGQSSFGMSSYGRMPGGSSKDQSQNGDAFARARASNAQASSSAGGHVGSIGWQAPEVIADRVSLEGGQSPAVSGGAESAPPHNDGGGGGSSSSWAMAGGPSFSSSRRTQAVDIFSLGCIFHHCIVPGSHPFGQWYEREANIIQEKASHLTELVHVPDAHDLVSLMTARDPDRRPSAREVCKHPFFWNDEKRLSFLLEFSDRLEQDAVQSALLVMVEAGADSVVGRSWDVRLDPELTEDAGRYRKYDFSSVRDLLRVVRNKRHHFHELPERVQGMMSPLPGGFLRYVEERFPQLLMHCTKVTGSLLREERLFKEYLVPFRRSVPNAPATPALTTVVSTISIEELSSADRGTDERPQAATLSPPPPPALSKPLSDTLDGKPRPDSESPSVVDADTDADRGGFVQSTGVQESGSGQIPGGGEELSSNLAPGDRGGVSTSPARNLASATPRGGKKTDEGGAGGLVGGATNAEGVPMRVTEQNGSRGEGALQDVLVWNVSGMAKSMGCRGWWRHQDHWQRRLDVTKQRPRGAHLNKALQDPKYRTRLCSHWENSKGLVCPMRRRGAGKCDFAHGGLELRVKANKRDRWGRLVSPDGSILNPDASGGEDTLGAARSIGRIRVENGEKDGAGSAAIAGGRGGGGGGSAGTGPGGVRQGKRTKGGAVAQGDGTAGGGNQGRQSGKAGIAGAGDTKAPGLNGVGPNQRGAASESRSLNGQGARSVFGERKDDVGVILGPAGVIAGNPSKRPSQLYPPEMRSEVYQQQYSSLPVMGGGVDPCVDAVGRLAGGVGVGLSGNGNWEPSQEQSQHCPGQSPGSSVVIAAKTNERANEVGAD